ncbi:hypothetical protein AC249_AIPGENE28089 [Exaiptasia diaphana]|nr:hypothetical protein AC249_AIPGENE28089 [Exaiptasia diaphana]
MHAGPSSEGTVNLAQENEELKLIHGISVVRCIWEPPYTYLMSVIGYSFGITAPVITIMYVMIVYKLWTHTIPGMNKAEPSDDEIHVTEQICCNFIAGNNPPCNKLQKVLIEVLEPNNLDKLLFTLTKMIDQNELTDILAFLRSMEVLDCSDCECINNKEMTTKKVIALVDVLNQRGPHKLWYMLHALQPKHKIFFSEKHGNIKCCTHRNIYIIALPKVKNSW